MASTASMASAPADALERDRQERERQTFLDCYESFRLLKDAYEEAPRPSADDVESVLSVLSSVLTATPGQNRFEVAGGSGQGAFVYAVADRRRGAEWMAVDPVLLSGLDIVEGRSWRLRLSPGVMGLRCADESKKERARERDKDRARKTADELARSMGCVGCPVLALRPVAGSVGEVMSWSARSRSRLAERVGSLDYSDWLQQDGALAMVTLTLPGSWLPVAPDGRTFKKLLKRFEMRWRRNVGAWRCLWKLEFQRRGAPHWHALLRVPALVGKQTFEEWLSSTWADVVNHPDESEKAKHLKAGTGVDYSGKDFSDPRRISLYFLGHSAKTTDGKEYQHVVPEEWQKPGKGPGRFWGHPGLEDATREIELSELDAVRAARVLRKVKRARAWTTAVLRERGKLNVGQRHTHNTFATELRQREGKTSRYKQARIRKKLAAAAALKGEPAPVVKRFVPSSLGAGGYAVGGWVLMNDALQLGVDVARWFDPTLKGPAIADLLGRGTVAERWQIVELCRASRGAAPSACALSTPIEE